MQQAKHNSTNTPIAAIFATDSLFALGGFFNVILLLNTKPNSGLFGDLVLVSQRLPGPTLSKSQADGNQENVQTEEIYMESLSDGAGVLPS